MAILGLDIGGANIKAADMSGRAISRPFAIWNRREELAVVLFEILRQFPDADQFAVTMTAELADCFSTKHEGVKFILNAVEKAIHQAGLVSTENRTGHNASAGDQIHVWSVDGCFVTPRQALDFSRKVAAANWHGLATWCGKYIPQGAGILIDIGTTTTDIIPLVDGRPVPVGLTDVDRLQSGELSYSGIWRTPICAVAHSVPFRDGYCSLAAEVFATTLDIYLLLEQIAEDESNVETANGKPATKSAAHDRLSRMLCCDRHEIPYDEAAYIAKFLSDVQRQRLAGSLERVVRRLPSACQTVVISGSGSFLAKQLIVDNRLTSASNLITLSDELSPEIAEASCAHALAQFASSSKYIEKPAT